MSEKQNPTTRKWPELKQPFTNNLIDAVLRNMSDLELDLLVQRDELLEKNQRLREVAERLCNVAEAFIRDHSDPGTEAMAAVHCARKELQNGR